MPWSRASKSAPSKLFASMVAAGLSWWAAPAQAQTGPARILLETMTQKDSGYVASLAGGGLAELTLDPGIQKVAEEVLESHEVPFGAAVVISVRDGKVLALAGRSTLEPALGPSELALRPWAPAASVFKVVAAAALVSRAGLSGSTRTCYHGGTSSVLADNLIDVPARDRRCDTLAYGIGKSQNAIVAKLSARHLRPATLRKVASDFGFGSAIPFEAAVVPSAVDLPSDRLEFARAAAGFWHSSLSALHGALIAATIAGDGVMPAARLVARAAGPDGRPLTLSRPPARRVLAPHVAREVGRMMELTTSMGTARNSFRDAHGRSLLPVEVAGKTGSLSYRGRAGDPGLPAAVLPEGGYLGYSWFVGYAPSRNPRVAFAVVLGNPADWRIKAPTVARQLVARYLTAGDQPAHAATLATR